MNKKAKTCLFDVLKAIEAVDDFLRDVPDFSHYLGDLKTKSAVERQLGIIGEAINNFRKVETVFVLTYARNFINFRNTLIHAYFRVDHAQVWDTVHKELPLLKQEVEQGLNLP